MPNPLFPPEYSRWLDISERLDQNPNDQKFILAEEEAFNSWARVAGQQDLCLRCAVNIRQPDSSYCSEHTGTDGRYS